MGLLSSFFERRRRRESAVHLEDGVAPVSSTREGIEPVGQPVAGVGPNPGPFGLGPETDVSSMIGMLGMIKDAYQSGDIQISHGSSQVIDMRGDTNVEELREQIMAAMQERGMDPDAVPDGTQVDAAQYAGLQGDLLRVLGEHGIDVSGPGSATGMPDTDGDGQPG